MYTDVIEVLFKISFYEKHYYIYIYIYYYIHLCSMYLYRKYQTLRTSFI